ncbi:MAG: polysaccharide deacetylase [Lachnospiraceae bacterium]|nr:polysaccharide deacetylase [Lachnospiraceae bacterium]
MADTDRNGRRGGRRDPVPDGEKLYREAQRTDEARRAERARIKEKRIKQRRRRVIASSVLVALILITGVTGIAIISRDRRKNTEVKAAKAAEIEKEEQEIRDRRNKIVMAEQLAKSYDYDAAIAMLQEEKDYDTDNEIIAAIAKFTAEKSTMEAKDPMTVPHIFYQSLIVQPERVFTPGNFSDAVVGSSNAFSATLEEFNGITKEMYENGWVIIRMRDLATETKDADGTVHFRQNAAIMLPADKKPFVLSVDDLVYHHSLEDKGYAEKLVLNSSGEVKAQYTDIQGNVVIGDYDVVPLLDAFIKAHPDASYRGAKGTIALSGYDGVFGYRTDTAYKTGEKLDKPQEKWLSVHEDFNWEKDVQDATKVANALKDSGWDFACNTWGHIVIADKTVDDVKADQEKWQKTVANITGPTDTIFFPAGGDVGTWRNYSEDANPLYAYYKSQGYNFYGIVDNSSESWIQIQDGYVRQGRIAVNGMQMWRVLSGTAKKNVFEQLFDVKSVFDERRPTPVSATGR